MVGGWLMWLADFVGKSDFNQNPAVSLDLDLGLRLWVCQKFRTLKGRYWDTVCEQSNDFLPVVLRKTFTRGKR